MSEAGMKLKNSGEGVPHRERGAVPDLELLQLLSDVLMKIRAIAGGPTGQSHLSPLGPDVSHEDALLAIYALADSAHNLPQGIIDGHNQGAGVLVEDAIAELAANYHALGLSSAPVRSIDASPQRVAQAHPAIEQFGTRRRSGGWISRFIASITTKRAEHASR